MPVLPPAQSARQRILDAASHLFYRDGLRATGVDRIIAESGVAKMSFYRHFAAKRDLIVAFLEQQRQDWIGWFRHDVSCRLGQAGAGLEVIADALDSWFSRSDFRGCAFINSVAEGAHREEPVARVVADHRQDLAVFSEEIAVRLALSPPKKVAEAVMVVIEGSVVRAQMSGREGTTEVARMLLHGIAQEYTGGKQRKPAK
jgi:AcrR family transcriptional regulator